MTDNSNSGTLFVVATPIGNLEDISDRAKRILREVSLIACEDTRHSRKLLNHLQIKSQLVSYYREKEQSKSQILIEKLLAGENIALVSDAGTPALSDPGSVLVRLARKAGIKVVPIPGPSALIVAISAAGLEEIGFFFGGFPPSKKNSRRTFFNKLAHLPSPLVFYESPHRIKSCLQDCIDVFGDRNGFLFKELTKLHENSFHGSLSHLYDIVKDGIKGELVLIIAGQPEDTSQPDNLPELLEWYKKKADVPLKEAVKRISSDLNIPRNKVYKQALKVWNKD